MAQRLNVGEDFDLPLDVATETTGILAKKGAGKSNAAAVLFEELYRNGVTPVVIDPKGDWWGLRSSADGQGPGLPIVVFGGKHGDVPIEPTGGAFLADVILGDDDRGYLACVVDVSQFTLSEQRRFLLAFGERLFRAKDEERVLHVILEEAHEYLPQSPGRDMAQLVSTWQRIVKQGRFKGLGVTVVTQRSAALSKDVLTQVDSLVVLKTMSPQDRDAVNAWIKVHVGASEVVSTLHTLKPGEAWLWSPDRFDDPVRIQFRRRSTFDSGATPKVGQKRAVPRTLADVDLAALKDSMAETIERAKAEDPKELRKEIATLRKEIATLRKRVAELESLPAPTGLSADDTRKLEEFARAVRPVVELGERMSQQLTTVTEDLTGVLQSSTAIHEGITSLVESGVTVCAAITERLDGGSDLPRARKSSRGAGPVDRQGAAQRPDPPAGRQPRRTPVQGSATSAAGVTRPQQRILDALAWWLAVRQSAPSRRQVAMVVGCHLNTKSFVNNLSALSTAGFVHYPKPGTVALTDSGLSCVDVPPPGTTEALQEMVFAQVGPARSRILRELIARHPESVSRVDLAEALEYHPNTKSFVNNLSSLRTAGFIDYPEPGVVVASGVLFL